MLYSSSTIPMGSPFVFLVNSATAAAAALTFLMAAVLMAAVFWRRAQPPSRHEEDPSSRANEVPIFLSHSGRQKDFVERLYDALKAANHTPFFDKHSLPRGSPFPRHIKRAAQGCKLGVVVLSDDFLTSKWPMLELEIMVFKRDRDAILLPLFYKISPEDLKKLSNKCRRAWQRNAKDYVSQREKWEEAVKSLSKHNGVVFTPGTSEATYMKKVVGLICNLVPSGIPYDLPLIQGCERIAKEVSSKFDAAARQCDKVCMVGYHGIAGMGKTTFCKIMCNFYKDLYPGRSYHIEFPSDGDDKKIAQECKKALTSLSDEYVLNKADSFDQVVLLMKENLGRCDVFLAIDNVWKSSLDAAKRMLGVGFSAKSKILWTSRSQEVLKDLLRNTNTNVHPLPSPRDEEALAIFRETSELDDLKSLGNKDLLYGALNKCNFSGKYHPLALKALGQYVKRACAHEGLDKIEQSLSDSLQGIDDVRGILEHNYVNLAVEKKHMFLDIVAVVMPVEATTRYFGITYAKARHWLSILYKEIKNSNISILIYELAMDGLIEIEDIEIDGRDEKMIRVHDIYSDIAEAEAARSARFFTNKSAKSVEEIEWGKLERVILKGGNDNALRFIEELQQQQCPKLQVLCAENINFMSGIQLDRMPSLCVLKFESGALRSITNWSASEKLAILSLRCAPPPL